MRTCRFLTLVFVAVTMASVAVAAEVAAKPEPSPANRVIVPDGDMVPRPTTSTTSIDVPKSSMIAIDQRISVLSSQMKQLDIQLSALSKQIDETKQRAKVGLLPSGKSLPDLEAEAEQLKEQVSGFSQELIVAKRLKALASPVDITLKSSTIRQAAEALSRASKLSIAVDPKVPQDVKVNAEAQNVPLGAVIEVIANAAGLIIAPTDNGGLLLRIPGKLVVEGTSYASDGDHAPWGNDWGIPGAHMGSPVGRIYLGLFDTLPRGGGYGGSSGGGYRSW